MIVCNKCKTLFESAQGIVPIGLHQDLQYKICPVRGCMGVLFDIDDPLVHVLILFWEHRFETFFSCSGHFYEKTMTPYIMFGTEIKSNPLNFFNLKKLHSAAVELNKARTPNHNYAIYIQCLEEKSVRLMYRRDPIHVHRFSINALNKNDSYYSRIETQAAFLQFLYDLVAKIATK